MFAHLTLGDGWIGIDPEIETMPAPARAAQTQFGPPGMQATERLLNLQIVGPAQRGALRISSTVLTVFTLTVVTRINRSITRSL